ncbi:glutamate 5-kinase [Mesobacillus maritimus]|uniref:glutamate 5-kinase n=1 Tax=Mesobacillus maritimus TaxID=1643336 RepID=UPI00203F4D66|nr:glutamate 5-kinase [Mesobacillus maritimus]MCM3584326.1 glutamate 5-kinase [Mesobacillus maritimus]MCM3669257.1 glutamate 5-kinase [Mesobacillus maritimus]
MEKKRIVVKIGSSSLTNEKGEIDQAKLRDHVEAVAALRNEGHEVLMVSSGAVAAGFTSLGYPTRPVTLKGKQAAAAVGQSLLIQSYIEQFSLHNIVPAQILLTRTDFSNRERYQNAYFTLLELLERKLLPIINENDTVSVEELTFGDNDMLSALVSGLIHADQLIILTDINGLYDSDPRNNPEAKRLDYLDEITDEMVGYAEGSGSKVGTGGMKSKLMAAKTALSLGVPVFIGQGKGEAKLVEIIKGNGDGTYIQNPQVSSINTRRQWIALHSEVSGAIFVDQGAEEAILHKGKSLLPAGVTRIWGTFRSGDVVEVFGPNGGLLGKGEIAYSADELKDVVGRSSAANTPLMEVIHRNHWVKV